MLTLVGGGHVDDPVGVDVERHFDLGHAARRRRNSDKVELPQQVVVGGHLTLSLQHLDANLRLVVSGRREHLRLLGGDGCVAVDQPGEDAAQRLDAQRQRRDIEQQHVLHVALEHTTLDRSTHGHNLIRVDALGRVPVEEALDDISHLGHASHAANHHHVLDLIPATAHEVSVQAACLRAE